MALVIGLGALLTACGNQSNTKNTKKMEKKLLFDTASLSESPIFLIKTTMGDIKVQLYKETPKHRDNFVKLASEGFYNNILFHRVINGFMIQTGDPLTKDAKNSAHFGTGGPGYTIPAEINPALNHIKGALAAARQGDQINPEKASSGSQFYIVQDERNCAQLDGQYTIFGKTLDGLDIIDEIAEVQTNNRDCPLNPIKIISIIPEKK
ncbi:MAG: peptidylprolyl isomerase [Bacteroidales bacterium]